MLLFCVSGDREQGDLERQQGDLFVSFGKRIQKHDFSLFKSKNDEQQKI